MPSRCPHYAELKPMTARRHCRSGDGFLREHLVRSDRSGPGPLCTTHIPERGRASGGSFGLTAQYGGSGYLQSGSEGGKRGQKRFVGRLERSKEEVPSISQGWSKPRNDPGEIMWAEANACEHENGDEAVTVGVEVEAASTQEVMWKVLTDYESVARICPNIVSSEVLYHRPDGRIRLRQVGASEGAVWRAAVAFEVDIESKRRNQSWELHFRGDGRGMRLVSGRWVVSQTRSSVYRCELRYEAFVHLDAPVPISRGIKEQVIKAAISKNVAALARRAEEMFAPGVRSGLDAVRSPIIMDASIIPPAAKRQGRSYLGMDTIRLPAAPPSAAHESERSGTETPELVDAGAGTEVHLRRLDDADGGIHWRILAAVRANAHVEPAWGVLTEYDSLADVVPQLVTSEEVESKENGRKTVRQAALKRYGPFALKGEATLECVEKRKRAGLEREVQFRMVQGDLDSLRGKVIVQAGREANTCILKYAADARSCQAGIRGIEPLEPLLERVAFEDVPSALALIAREAEQRWVAFGRPPFLSKSEQEEAASDLDVLGWHLRSAGFNDKMPSSALLKDQGRTDLEGAVREAGGPAQVATALGWDLRNVNRPKSWWYRLENIRSEIDEFNRQQGIAPDTMPSATFVRKAGRRDLARGMEYHSGAKALAKKLGLRYPSGGQGRRRVRWADDDGESTSETPPLTAQ